MKSTYDKMMHFFEKRGLDDERRKLVSKAYGRVLEIGVGTGVNLRHYRRDLIQDIQFTDFELDEIVQFKIDQEKFDAAYEIKKADVMTLPYEALTFDTIVCTLVFCSVSDVEKGLLELKRVLKNDGQLIFIEHVLPEGKVLKALFNGVTPLWKRMASNCHLNRNYLKSLEQGGFEYTLEKRFFKSTFVSGIARKIV